MQTQVDGKGVSVSWEYQEEESEEACKLALVQDNCQLELSNKQGFSETGHVQQVSGTKNRPEDGGESSTSGGRCGLQVQKVGVKRRAKMERKVNL